MSRQSPAIQAAFSIRANLYLLEFVAVITSCKIPSSTQTKMAASTSISKLTWKQRFLIALALAAAGIIYAVGAFLDEFSGFEGDRQSMASVLLWFLPLAGLGAFISGILLASGFGRPGKVGWVLALATGFVATALSGAIGGTFLFPGFGTGLGPLFALGHMVQFPLLTILWLALMAGVHKLAMWLRRGG